MEAKFRSDSAVVKLNVNDDGFCVKLFVGDDGWIKRFLDFLLFVEEKNKEHEKALSGVDDVEKHLAHMLEFDNEIKESFDGLFGENAYAETFGVELAGVEYIIEFLDACIPYVESRVEKRNKAFEKYNSSRTGGAK